jgi:hypothetical protein
MSMEMSTFFAAAAVLPSFAMLGDVGERTRLLARTLTCLLLLLVTSALYKRVW